jgi:hypothetical protein
MARKTRPRDRNARLTAACAVRETRSLTVVRPPPATLARFVVDL